MVLGLSVDTMQLVNHAVPHEKLFSQALSEMGKDGAHPTPYSSSREIVENISKARVSLTPQL